MQVALERRLLGFRSVRIEVTSFAHKEGQGGAGVPARRSFGGDEFFLGIDETRHGLVFEEFEDE